MGRRQLLMLRNQDSSVRMCSSEEVRRTIFLVRLLSEIVQFIMYASESAIFLPLSVSRQSDLLFCHEETSNCQRPGTGNCLWRGSEQRSDTSETRCMHSFERLHPRSCQQRHECPVGLTVTSKICHPSVHLYTINSFHSIFYSLYPSSSYGSFALQSPLPLPLCPT